MTTGRINQVTIVRGPRERRPESMVRGGVQAPDAASPPGVSPAVRTKAPSNCRDRIPQSEVRSSTRRRGSGARASSPQEEAVCPRSRREADTGAQAYPRVCLKIAVASGQRSTDSTSAGWEAHPDFSAPRAAADCSAADGQQCPMIPVGLQSESMPCATGTKWCEPSREPHLNPQMLPPSAIAGRKAPRSSHRQLNGQSCERDLLLDFGQTETAAGQAGIVEPPAASWIGKPTQHTTSSLVYPSTIAIRRLAWQAACSSCISSDNLSDSLSYRLSGSFFLYAGPKLGPIPDIKWCPAASHRVVW